MLNNELAVVGMKRAKKNDMVISNRIGTFVAVITKRTMDITAGLVGVMILIPLTIILYIVKLVEHDKGPLFFSQLRIGKDGKLFKMYKFRTMVINADEELEKILANNPEAREEYSKFKKLTDDPRVTKIGKFLRKTSLDEFAQFVNVLKGDMSLVGPRPYLPREVADMGYYYYYVVQCKPGITGLWQVSGRSEVSFDERLELDYKYYNDKSVTGDIGLVLKTVVKTLKHEGAV